MLEMMYCIYLVCCPKPVHHLQVLMLTIKYLSLSRAENENTREYLEQST